MTFDRETTLPPDQVLDRAVEFFGTRVPHHAAFPEKRGSAHLVLRGQGGEEIAITARATDTVTRVRASTLLFDHALDRFLSTLPPAGGES
ncbi:MAG TPA: hypothetical protein PLL69_10060 [Gemmatimonadales bacterium]|nr:hypothetical protein [Gemmatimonadales bacterium]